MKIVIKDVEVDVKYPKKLYDLHSDLSFLPRRMKQNLQNKKKICCTYKVIKTSI